LQSTRQPPGAFFNGPRTPIPTDIWWLLGVLFATYAAQNFAPLRGIVEALRLDPQVLRGGVWRLATYAFAGFGAPSPWILLELFIVGLFGRDVYQRVGRKGFWRLLLTVSVVAGFVAVIVNWVVPAPAAFTLMQGQRIVLTILIAAFATMASEAVILLFFVLPIQAKWFLLLEVLLAFIYYLGSGDLAGFVGIVVAVVVTNRWLDRSGANPLRRLRLQIQHYLYRLRLAWARKRRGLKIVKDETPKQGPWVN